MATIDSSTNTITVGTTETMTINKTDTTLEISSTK